MSIKLEDYALIGDCETAALVSRGGSIDWLCWPRFDSAACFAALLGGPQNGRWRLAPKGEGWTSRRAYRKDTLVLETEFSTATGKVAVVDFMPTRAEQCDLVRLVFGRSGRVAMEMELALRFDYGSTVPWVTRLHETHGIRAIAGPDLVALRTTVATHGEDLKTVARFEVGEGDVVPFVLAHQASHLGLPKAIDPMHALRETESYWREWNSRCTLGGEWQDAVRRSLITLKALTYAPTGGIIAAPTTSLPEQIGGVRNWDYRYCWLRDATFTLYALLVGGYTDEAAKWRNWLLRAVAGDPADLQIMYGPAGERRLRELELPWLPGYEGSVPVRIGNAASGQRQLDIYGEVMDAMHLALRSGVEVDPAAWELQKVLMDCLENVWEEPDEGIWEVRGPRRQFTHSKVMAWVAFDRAIQTAQEFTHDGPIERWREVRDRIHRQVCERGFNKERNTFTQFYGSEDVDASLLLLSLVGFLEPDDPRMLGTVAAIERDLMRDGFLMRYPMHEGTQKVDGLPPGEGVFLPCTCWLADNYALQGRHDEARAIFTRLAGLTNDLGLISEEYDHRARRLLGNFPQAFTHVSLVNTARNLTARHGAPAEDRRSRSSGQPDTSAIPNGIPPAC